MLVLSRKIGEKICIGDRVTITVVDIGRGRIRLGIEAPRGVRVDRLEVHLAREAQPAPPAPAADPAGVRGEGGGRG